MNLYQEFAVRYPNMENMLEDIKRATQLIVDCYRSGGKVLICGNGGSASDSCHIVGELMKGFLKKRPLSNEERAAMHEKNPNISDALLDNLQGSLPAINLTENSGIISAFANDVDPANVYAQQVLGYGQYNDVLIGITTSGNSENIINACNVAKAIGVNVIGLTGKDGGALKNVSDVCLIAPENETFKIQECHLPIYHLICAAVEDEFYNA